MNYGIDYPTLEKIFLRTSLVMSVAFVRWLFRARCGESTMSKLGLKFLRIAAGGHMVQNPKYMESKSMCQDSTGKCKHCLK